MKVMVLPIEQLYTRAAELFVETAQAAVSRGGFTVALSGGSTPKPLYALLPAEYADQIDWRKTHIFFSDERCVPPNHPDSNYEMVNETLITPLSSSIPAENIHRMRGEDEPREAAAAYSQELAGVLGPTPQFDLLLLGIGDDCHTASIFPGSEVIYESERTVASPFVPKLDAYRLTLTPAVLRAARRTMVLAVGPGKAEAVARAIEGEYQPEQCPAQLLREAEGEVIWMADNEAGARLGKPRNTASGH